MVANPDQEAVDLARLYRPLELGEWYEPLYERAVQQAGDVLEFLDPSTLGYELISTAELDYHKKVRALRRIKIIPAEVKAIAGNDVIADVLDIIPATEDGGYFLALSIEANGSFLGGERKRLRRLIDNQTPAKLHWRGIGNTIKLAKMSVARPPLGLVTELMEIAPETVTLKPVEIVEL